MLVTTGTMNKNWDKKTNHILVVQTMHNQEQLL
jgi:hypothetical protein